MKKRRKTNSRYIPGDLEEQSFEERGEALEAHWRETQRQAEKRTTLQRKARRKMKQHHEDADI